jgi:hypothetical protein
MEWGFVRGIDHSWQTLPFAKSYTDPVLIAKPASNAGADPGIVRLKDVAAGHAQLRYQEWSYLDGPHGTPEGVFYLLSEAGEHRLGGLMVEAHWLVSNKLGRVAQWEGIPFNTPFTSNPAVFASVMTQDGGDPVTTRIANLDVSGLDLAMDEQESMLDGHVNETVGWIAIAQGSGTTAEGRNLEVFSEQFDHALRPVLYRRATSHRHPTVVGDVDSTYGADPVSLRYANPTNAQIELKLSEEQSADTETAHVLEDVGLFVGE